MCAKRSKAILLTTSCELKMPNAKTALVLRNIPVLGTSLEQRAPWISPRPSETLRRLGYGSTGSAFTSIPTSDR